MSGAEELKRKHDYVRIAAFISWGIVFIAFLVLNFNMFILLALVFLVLVFRILAAYIVIKKHSSR